MKRRIVIIGLALACVLICTGLFVRSCVRHLAEQKISKAAARLPRGTKLSYGDVDVRILGPALVLRNVSLSTPGGRTLEVEKIVLHDFDRRHRRPHFLRADLKGVTAEIDSRNFGSLSDNLTDLGYKQIKADIQLEYRYDEKTEKLSVPRLVVHAKDMGDMKARLQLRSFSPGRIARRDPEGLVVEDLYLEYDDQSFLKTFTSRALETDRPFRDFVLQGLQQDIESARNRGEPAWAESLDALSKFLRAPNRFSVKMELRRPVSLESLMSQKKLSRLRDAIRISFSAGFPTRTGGSAAWAENSYAERIRDLRHYRPALVTTIYARDGEVVSSMYREKRFLVDVNDLPRQLVRAFLAAEDSAFYEHEGVDIAAIFRAVTRNVAAGDIVQGGSTITQQVVKQLILGPERTFARKVKEAVIACRLEDILSKDEILSIYLNEIYFGAGAYGVEAAAQTFFAKSAKDLTLAEAALVAGLPRGPSLYNPFRTPETARTRQEYVLRRMLDLGWITESQYEDALFQPLVYESTPQPSSTVGAYYIEEVRRWLASDTAAEKLREAGIDLDRADVDEVYKLGLQVYTAMDLTHQAAAEEALRDVIDEKAVNLEPQSERLQGALVSIDPLTGDVLALVGGYDFKESQFNRATQARRQPGSAFKPFVYSAALDAGYTSASILTDSPKTFVDRYTDEVWEPNNFGEKYYGPTLLRTALVKSLNLATVQLAEAIGIEAVTRRARAMGLECPLPPYLSVSLGSMDVSLLNLCQAYTTFARGGSYVKPRLVLSIRDQNGREIYQAPTESVDAISPQNAFIMDCLLKEVIQSGTATVCRQLERPAAGKTGTTNDERDAWFIGFTPYLLTGVYVGYDDYLSMGRAGVGGLLAAPIWLKYRLAVEDLYPEEDFPEPPGIVFRRVTACSGDSEPAGVTYLLPFIEGTEPADETREPSGGLPADDFESVRAGTRR
jgi:penicillin-binding protein 1A